MTLALATLVVLVAALFSGLVLGALRDALSSRVPAAEQYGYRERAVVVRDFRS